MNYNIAMFNRLKEIYSYAKENLIRPRYIYSYFFMPILYGAGILDLLVAFTMMLVNSKKLLIPSLILFGVLIVAFIVAGIINIVVKKKEIKEEAVRLEFFFNSTLEKEPILEYVLPNVENNVNIPIVFASDCIVIDKVSYPYSSFSIALFTSNYMYHANLIVLFSRKDDAKEEDENAKKVVKNFSLPLDINLLSIMNNFNLQLENSDVLAFIRDNPELAAKQILKYGKIQRGTGNPKVR